MPEVKRIWGRFVLWLVIVWIAVTVGGVVAGAAWGLGGFDCEEPGHITLDGPCPVPTNPSFIQLGGFAAAGALRLGLAAASLSYAPAIVFALLTLGVGWFLAKAFSPARAESAPWLVLAVAGLGAIVAILVASPTDPLLWLGLATAIGVAALGVHLTGQRSTRHSPVS